MRKLYWLVLALTLGVVSFYFAKHSTIHLKAYADIKTTPFVLETSTYNFETNPQGKLIVSKVVARRSDGSTAEVLLDPRIPNSLARRVMFMNGTAVHIYNLVSSKNTVQMNAKELARLKERLLNPDKDCFYFGASQKTIDRPVISGEQFLTLQYELGSERWTRMVAPQLGCELLTFRMEIRQPDGSYKLKAESRLTSFELKEPEPAFFDLAANYDEVLPSEIMRREFQKIGSTPSQKEIDSAAAADKYAKDRQ